MRLEVCVDSLESAANAIYNGADELEVCRSLSLGGLTPSVALVNKIIDMIDLYMASQDIDISKRPKVNVMIRCREGWDFCYNTSEEERMLQEISEFQRLCLNIDSFVFGALTEKRDVNVDLCKKIIAHAYPTTVSFHRAFDRTRDPVAAIEDIIKLGIGRLLTSGLGESAADKESRTLLAELIDRYGCSIQIMPGAGINVDNVKTFAEIGCDIIHGSFKVVRGNRIVTDGEMVRRVKDILKSIKNSNTKDGIDGTIIGME